MTERPNILVICGRNKRRSRTAESIFKNDNRFNILSVGLSPKSDRKLSEKDINWSDLIFVMENEHRSRIRKEYRNIQLPPIEVLNIKDKYEFMDPKLINMLTDKINNTLKAIYKL